MKVRGKKLVPFSKVFIGEKEREYLKEVLDSGWLTTAGKTFEFEKRFAEYVRAGYASAVNSCTAAMHLGLEALRINPGDKVFVPAMTFTASAEIIRYLGADPIFLDVEYQTNLITPEILSNEIESGIEAKAIVIVHYGGHPAEMDKLVEICRSQGIKILEDAAHAFPTKYKNKMIGSFGDVTCFSFYANKTITTGEGGMVVTDDEDINNRIKVMRLHGINRDIWNRFTSKTPDWEYDVIEAGYKYNMPDVNAAIGLGQLERAEVLRMERQKVAEFYYKNLSGIDEIDLPICKVQFEDHAWHLFPIVLNDKAKISRNEFIIRMSEAGIGTSVHYKPLYRMTYYKERYGLMPENFPNCEKTWKGNVSLPVYPYMEEEDMVYVVGKVRELVGVGIGS